MAAAMLHLADLRMGSVHLSPPQYLFPPLCHLQAQVGIYGFVFFLAYRPLVIALHVQCILAALTCAMHSDPYTPPGPSPRPIVCHDAAGGPQPPCPAADNACCDAPPGSGAGQNCYNTVTSDCCTSGPGIGYVCAKGKCATPAYPNLHCI